MRARDETIAAAKERLRAAGWYVRYTEWPSGHQVVLHRREDPSVHRVTDWRPSEGEAFAEALSLAERYAREGGRGGVAGAETRPAHAREASARALDLAIVGRAREELVVQTPRLPAAGEILEGALVARVPGGNAVRRAIAAARLGGRVAVVSRVGEDPAGAEVVARLRAEGVDAARVRRDADATTVIALVHRDRRGRTSTATASRGGAAPSVEDVRAGEPAIREAGVVLAFLDAQPEGVLEGFRLARAHGARTVLDCDPPRRPPAALLRATDLAVVAARDARVVTGAAVTGRRSALGAARALLGRLRGGAVVLTTERAVLLSTRNDELWIPNPREDWTDVREAGDAFSAMLAVALAGDPDLSRAVRLATAAAALAMSGPEGSPRLPHRAEVAALAGQPSGSEELTLDGIAPADASHGPAAPP